MVSLEVRDIPTGVGVYHFYQGERCLYVGKAVNLRQRLASYLATDGPSDARIRAMVNQADRVEWLVLDSETDALLCEASLISRLQPEYNIRLRQSYPYPAVAVDTRDGVARLMLWRGEQRKGVRVYGPYPGKTSSLVIDAITSAVPFRTCDGGKFAYHSRLETPCLLGDIGRCPAPCVSADGYDDTTQAVISLLEGNDQHLLEATEAAMCDASRDLKYEVAGRKRDQMRALATVRESRLLSDARGRSINVVGVHTDDLGGGATWLTIHNGVIVHVQHHIIDSGEATAAACIDALVSLIVRTRSGRSRTILHSHIPGEGRSDARTFDGNWRARTGKTAAERRLIRLAEENACETVRRARLARASDRDARRRELTSLQHSLSLSKAPLRIEAVDVSHLGGSATVSVVSVLLDGVPAPRQYRRYRLTDVGGDDYAAMAEAVTRRLSDSLDGTIPLMDLLLVDGGPAQLAVANNVLHELGLVDVVECASLAKRLEEVYRPGSEQPVFLERNDPGLYLLQRARDETHRASNAYQRRLAARGLRTDYLSEVPGLGPKRKEMLLEAVGGWQGLEGIEKETLDAISHIPAQVRQDVWDLLVRRRGSGSMRGEAD